MKTLIADCDLLKLRKIVSTDNALMLIVNTTQSQAACPRCQTPSAKIHARYQRRVADLPWGGIAVTLQLHARKFCCQNESCRQQIFCERLPPLVAPFARKTIRLNQALAIIGFALGGEAGARTALQLGLAVSPDTLLNRIRVEAAQRRAAQTVTVLGVDDFALRRGERYGTILVDLERHQVIDLLKGREAKPLAEWLKAHPEVGTISRDRAPAYLEGCSDGAPHAEQVADRWHLVHNLTEAYEKLLQHHYREIKEAVQKINSDAAVNTEMPSPVPQVVPQTASEYMRSRTDRRRRQDYHAERKERYEQIKGLQQQGQTIAQIARQTGMSYNGVTHFFQSTEYPVISRGGRGSQVDRFAAYLSKRWGEGCHNARQLYREIYAQGYRATELTVRRFLMPWRRADQKTVDGTNNAPIIRPKVKLPSARACVWLLLKEEEQLTDEQLQLRQQLEQSAIIKQGRDLVQGFRSVLRSGQVEKLDKWMAQTRQSGLVEFTGFITGIERDLAAVKNAVTSKWSNGQTEAQVNRLKMYKRQMYGRAGVELLKARVMYAP